MVWWHRKIHNTNVKKQFCDDSYELQKLETFFAVILFQVQQCECMTGALSLTLSFEWQKERIHRNSWTENIGFIKSFVSSNTRLFKGCFLRLANTSVLVDFCVT